MATQNEAVEAPAAEAVEAKIEFTAEQQAKIEEIIKNVSGRVASDLRADNKRLQRELDAAKVQAPVTPDLARDLDLTRAEIAALKAEQAETRLTKQLEQAAGDTFISPLGVRVMRDYVKIGADGKPVVVDESGNPRLNSQFAPMSLSELAQAIAEQHKYIARGRTLPGAGSVLAQGVVKQTEPTLAQLFGPRSDGGLANALALKSPSEYRRLKTLAREKGLIA